MRAGLSFFSNALYCTADMSLRAGTFTISAEGNGKIAAGSTAKDEKSFTHQTCRHILVQKQSEALRISDEIHNGKISFNEAAFQFSEDKAGAHGLLGDKAQNEVRAEQSKPRILPTATRADACSRRA